MASSIIPRSKYIIEDMSGTTGSSQYMGYYYADITPSHPMNKMIGMFVRSTSSNYPAFVVALPQKVRIFTPQSNVDVTVRMLFD